MGGRFTLLLSLRSLSVYFNLPATIHPLITCLCLSPPSFTLSPISPPFLPLAPPPIIPLSLTTGSPFPHSHFVLFLSSVIKLGFVQFNAFSQYCLGGKEDFKLSSDDINTCLFQIYKGSYLCFINNSFLYSYNLDLKYLQIACSVFAVIRKQQKILFCKLFIMNKTKQVQRTLFKKNITLGTGKIKTYIPKNINNIVIPSY